MLRNSLGMVVFLIVVLRAQWGFTENQEGSATDLLLTSVSIEREYSKECFSYEPCIFLEPPANFCSQMEVSGCFCEYQNEVLLLLRHPEKPQGNTWCIPGGKLERGEIPMQAVIREVWEETGLLLEPESLTYCKKVFVRFPNKDFILHLFHAGLTEISKQLEISSEEHSGYRWVSVEEALRMPLIPGGGDCMRLALYDIVPGV